VATSRRFVVLCCMKWWVINREGRTADCWRDRGSDAKGVS